MDIIKTIKEVYNNPINESNLEYYYVDKKSLCCDIELPLLFNEITDFDYLQPIKNLQIYFQENDTDYYQGLIDRNQNLQKPLYIKDYNYDLDEILLQYIKCIPDLKLSIIWPVDDIKFEDITNTFGDSQVHAIKEINLSEKQIEGVIFQINYDDPRFKTFDGINDFIDKTRTDADKNKVFLIYYKGSNTYFQTFNNPTKILNISQLFLNKNSLRVLQYQRLDRIIYKNYDRSLFNLMTFKNWLYQEIHPIDQIRFLLLSGITLFALGLRQASDIDVIILPEPTENTATDNFIYLVEKYLFDPKTRFSEMEGAMKKKDGWYLGDVRYEYMDTWIAKEWPALFGAYSMDEVILNPKFHYYFLGLKMIIPKAEIKRRIKRNRPAAYSDLIAMIKILKIELDIPPIQTEGWSGHVHKQYDEKGIKKIYNTTKFYLKKRYDLDVSIEEIKKLIPNTLGL